MSATEEKELEKLIALPPLPYAENALEPHIDAETMHTHHQFHHGGYTKKFRGAYKKLLENADLKAIADKGVANVVTNESLDAVRQIDKGLAGTLQNNGGGWINHTLFWNNMAPAGKGGGDEPQGALADAITAKWGSFAEFKGKFKDAGTTRFGSGWVWLVKNQEGLKLYSTPNQDGPHNTPGETPLLGLDVWEHAYYLKYKNERNTYIDAWWNVVNWSEVQKRYEAAQ